VKSNEKRKKRKSEERKTKDEKPKGEFMSALLALRSSKTCPTTKIDSLK